MATVLNAVPAAEKPNAKTREHDPLPMPILLLALLMAGLGVLLWKTTDQISGLVMAVPLVLCAFARPHFFLNLAIALSPYTYSLAGESYAGSKEAVTSTSAAFGMSDLFLLLVFPGLIFWVLTHPGKVKLGRFAPAVVAFLAVCMVSYTFNFGAMGNSYISYFIGFLRSAQIILVLPVAFAALDWKPRQIRGMLLSYLSGATILGIIGLVAFALGTRSGLYILGNHKNGTGLALAFGALIAIAALTQKPTLTVSKEEQTEPEPLGIPRWFLVASTVICLLACLAALSRGAYLATLIGLFYISVARKRGRIFGTVIIMIALGVSLLMVLLPEKEAAYVKDVSTTRGSNHSRIDQAALAIQRFEENPLLGDGLRARRDFLPHNLEMVLLSETGLFGILMFLWLTVAQFKAMRQARQMFTGDPLREWFVVAICACAIAILIHSQTDPYWRRGPLWLPWAGTGLIFAMMREENKKRRAVALIQQEKNNQAYRLERAEIQRQRALSRVVTPTEILEKNF